MCTPRWRSICWRRWPLRIWTAARADSGPQTTGRDCGAPATRVAAAVTVVSPGTDTPAPAARALVGGRPPEASNGRREDAGTASGQLTLAYMPADLTAVAPMTADTVTGGQREAVAAVGSTTATWESLTVATAAAAAEAAEEEDTVAGSNPATLSGTTLGPCLHYFSFLLLTISNGI
jgi:hypothetical protein